MMAAVLQVTSGGPGVPLDDTHGRAASLVDDEGERLRRALRLTEPPLLLTDGTLHASGIGGAVMFPGLIVDIVPSYLCGHRCWRSVFVAMLTAAEGLVADVVPDRPEQVGGPLIDQLAMVVRTGIEEGLRRGMPRQYVERNERIAGIRGQIDAARLWRHAVDRSGYQCRFTELSDEHPVVDRLVWAARRLADGVSAGWLAGELRELVEHFPVQDGDLSSQTVEVESQYPYLVPAVNVANILARCPTRRAAVWDERDLYHRLVQRVTRWHPSQGPLPALDLSVLTHRDGLDRLRRSVRDAARMTG